MIFRLQGLRRFPCIVVAAPAGYGKTTAVAEWLNVDGRQTVWLTLDSRHNDPALLVGSIAAVLSEYEPLDDSVLAPLAAPKPDIARVMVPRLCEALGERDGAVIVLDDLHELSGSDSLEAIAAFADCLPERSQIVLVSRAEPAIGLGRLRGNGRLSSIEVSELSMTRSEASRLFSAIGHDLDANKVELLVARTEGWPAALYLAALWLEHGNASADALDEFTGEDRFVADYLKDAFLGRISPEMLEFLIEVSILDRLQGELCDRVAGREGSGNDLLSLARSNLLLVPLDRKDHEYRFHPLLREMLQSELRRLGSGRELILHRRASEWYADRGDIDRAVAHAISSRDIRHAGELILGVAGAYASGGRLTTLRRWLDAFSEEELLSSPPLCLTCATVAIAEGDGGRTRRWATATLTSIERIEDEDERLVLTARILRSTAVESDLAATADRLAVDFARMPTGDVWSSLSRLAEGGIRHVLGDSSRARGLLREGSDQARETAPAIQVICLALLASIELEEDDVEAAWAHVHRGLVAAEHYGIDGMPGSAMLYAVASFVAARRADTEGATRRVKVALHLMEQRNDLNPWFEAETKIAVARALILLDDAASARSLLAEAERCVRAVPEAKLLGTMLAAARKEADSAAESERWPLTPAELRLLHLLPTHLSFPEIAKQLYVSTNTIKTQARSIYRKFGVSSRAEAVACARTAGLLLAQSPASGDAATTDRE